VPDELQPSIREIAERYASDPEFKQQVDEALGVRKLPTAGIPKPGQDIDPQQVGILGHAKDPDQQGKGRVVFESDLERAQTEELTAQMMRATEAQHQFASEYIQSIRFLETDGSRTAGRIELSEFEIQTNTGKKLTLTSPLMYLDLDVPE
jgi:hypothetical protein